MIKNKRTKPVSEVVVETPVVQATPVEEVVSRGTVIYTTDKIFTDMEIITEQSMIIAKQFKLTFEGVKFTIPSILMNIAKVVTFLKTVKPNVEVILETIKD